MRSSVLDPVQGRTPSAEHYLWAGLDFMLDQSGTPFFLEANRSSHMLWEYVEHYGDYEPFRCVAAAMTEVEGAPALLWRKQDPLEGDGEHACWIGSCLSRFLDRAPVVAFVEDNQEDRDELLTNPGTRVRPGSLFRWWYPLSWSYERSGIRVINPNSVWLVVRDKLASYRYLSGAQHFRVPWSVAVENAAEAADWIARHADRFVRGYVVKPRTSFGGHGVIVAPPGDLPQEVPENSMLCERVVPPLNQGQYWDVRVFVMAGKYCGGLVRTSAGPVTNVFQGGKTTRLPDALAARLEPAALEAVGLLDAAASVIHSLPQPPDDRLTQVVW